MNTDPIQKPRTSTPRFHPDKDRWIIEVYDEDQNIIELHDPTIEQINWITKNLVAAQALTAERDLLVNRKLIELMGQRRGYKIARSLRS